jgi:hypothetical protein
MIPSQDPSTAAAQGVLSGIAPPDSSANPAGTTTQQVGPSAADLAAQGGAQTSGDVMQSQGGAPLNGRQAPPAPQPLPPQKHSVMSDILHAVAEVLGGPKTVKQVDPATGNVIDVPLSREQRIARQIGIFARGAAAGAAQTGPGHLGKAALAGVQAQQQVNQEQQQNLVEQQKLGQQAMMDRASIAMRNNEYLLSLRRFDLESNEFKQKLLDSSNAMAMTMEEAGASKVPMIVNGKDVNGTGDEASIMNWISQHPKPPKGYSYLPVFSLDSDGKMVHTVLQYPHNTMNDVVTIPTQRAKDLGIPVGDTEGDTIDVKRKDIITANSQHLKDLNDQSEIDVHGQQIKTGKSEEFKNYAEGKAALQNAGTGGGSGKVDDFGVPAAPMKPAEYNKRYDNFGTKYVQPLRKLDEQVQQFKDITGAVDKSGNLTGAQSVVGLFNAIGISATPLKGMGFRINSNTVSEHEEARGLGQSLYQKFLGLKAGDVVTPQQLKDYGVLASQTRENTYSSAIDEARRQGMPVDFLPRGNNQPIDASTARMYLRAANGDPAKARTAAQKAGWVMPQGAQ